MIPCPPYVLEHFPKPCIPRKPHRCRICGTRIAVVEPCCRWSGVEAGEGFWTCYAHPECYALTHDWDHGDWECHTPGDGPRPEIRMHWVVAAIHG